MLGVPARSAVLTFKFLPLARTSVSLWFRFCPPVLQFVLGFILCSPVTCKSIPCAILLSLLFDRLSAGGRAI
jgi:hypothetical protein